MANGGLNTLAVTAGLKIVTREEKGKGVFIITLMTTEEKA